MSTITLTISGQELKIELPDNCKAEIDGNRVTISGPQVATVPYSIPWTSPYWWTLPYSPQYPTYSGSGCATSGTPYSLTTTCY